MHPTPTTGRISLHIGPHPFGSVALPLLDLLLDGGLPLRPAGNAVALAGNPDAALAQVADWLRRHGHAGRWRDEKLAVADARGRVLASVERGVVRVLGIATTSVQLHARNGDGDGDGGSGSGWWLQQRALDKATDPGLWDTLMGGMVAAGETVRQALLRETREEAGIDLRRIRLRSAGSVVVQRAVADSGTHGWLVETMHAFACTLPPGLVPVNRDGEVLRFACHADAGIDRLIAAGQLTREAATAVVLCRAPASR